MARPTVVFNNLTGSDTQASGAGPASAVFGTQCRSRVFSENKFGFYEASPPNLSSVLIDGTHALWCRNLSGKKFFRITAKKDTQQIFTGNINSNTQLTSVSSTSGLAIGDLIRVAAAAPGPTDLYTKISNISGSTITMADAASNTAVGVGCLCPKQVTGPITSPIAITSFILWGIGGKRSTLNHADSDDVLSDAEAGWTIELQFTGVSYTGGVTLSAFGDLADGPVKLIGTGAQKPSITHVLGSPVLTIGQANSRVLVKNLILTKSGTANVPCLEIDTNGSRINIVDVDISNSATGGTSCHGVRIGQSQTGQQCGVSFRGCSIKNVNGAGIRVVAIGTTQRNALDVYNCYIAHTALEGIGITRLRGLTLWSTILYDFLEGIKLDADASGDSSSFFMVACTLDGKNRAGNPNQSAVTTTGNGTSVQRITISNATSRLNGSFVSNLGSAQATSGVVFSLANGGGFFPNGRYTNMDPFGHFADIAFSSIGLQDPDDDNFQLSTTALIGRAFPSNLPTHASDVDPLGPRKVARDTGTSTFTDIGASQQRLPPPIISGRRKVS